MRGNKSRLEVVRSSAVHYFGWGTANPHLVSDEGLVVVQYAPTITMP